MYRRVIADLEWDAKADRDQFADELKTKLDQHQYYERHTTHGTASDGAAQSVVDVRPTTTAAADEIYQFIVDKMGKIPVLTGLVHWHDCTHDEGPPFDPCEPQEVHTK